MNRFVTKGTVSAVLGVAGIAALFAGKPAFASFLQNPDTAVQVIAAISAALTLFAGASKGIAKDEVRK